MMRGRVDKKTVRNDIKCLTVRLCGKIAWVGYEVQLAQGNPGPNQPYKPGILKESQ
jgi:hypothetical protein